MLPNVSTSQGIWLQIEASVAKDAPEVVILHQLARKYTRAIPGYIPAYELEIIVDELGYSKHEVWKPLIDFLCFKTELLELNFRLIEGDEHHEISFETLQSILAGESITFGINTYSSLAAQKNIFPYLIPTEKFGYLLASEGASNV